ncbi:universal stress protein [Streptomyces xanthochromogenes]|uniref:universal stress protein n=1 Tax=Streptomyces xanthochromogenes TaxID=67384 RepID=UPI00342E8874
MKDMTRGSDPGPVVVGIDGSRQARRAALWAADEAVRRGVSLHLVHATDTDGREAFLSESDVVRISAGGRELLDDTAAVVAERRRGLPVTTELSHSAPAVSLHAAVPGDGVLVVGHRGLGGFNALLLGSVGLKVAAGADTAVIVVRGDADAAAETNTVLVAVRDEHDLICARHAARTAAARKSTLRILHVWNVLQSVGNAATMLDGMDEMAQGRMGSVTAVADLIRDEFPELTVHVDAESSMSVAAVLIEASHHADLLVMGGRRSPGYIGATLGHVTHTLVHHAHCPVELVPRLGLRHGSVS